MVLTPPSPPSPHTPVWLSLLFGSRSYRMLRAQTYSHSNESDSSTLLLLTFISLALPLARNTQSSPFIWSGDLQTQTSLQTATWLFFASPTSQLVQIKNVCVCECLCICVFVCVRQLRCWTHLQCYRLSSAEGETCSMVNKKLLKIWHNLEFDTFLLCLCSVF